MPCNNGFSRLGIASRDVCRSLLQLLSDTVEMLEPIKGRFLGPSDVEKKLGVPPSQVGDLLALVGDAADNIPGAPGIGLKTAAKLLAQFGSLARLLDNIGEVKVKKTRESLEANREKVQLSRRLVELVTDAPVVGLGKMRFRAMNASRINEFYEAQDFKIREKRASAKKPAAPAEVKEASIEDGGFKTMRLAHGKDWEEWRCRVVTQPEELEIFLARATGDGFIGIAALADSEDGHSACLVGLSLALRSGEACYIPLAHAPGEAVEGSVAKRKMAPAPLEESGAPWPTWEGPGGLAGALELLRGILEDPSVLKIGHNIKFLITILTWNMAAGGPLKLERFDDVMLIAYTLFAGKGSKYELEDMVQEHFGGAMLSLKNISQVTRGKPELRKISPDAVIEYCAEFSAYAICLHRSALPGEAKCAKGHEAGSG